MGEYERLPVDSRIIKNIQKSPAMRAEQGESFMGGWGGPGTYIDTARVPIEARAVYVTVVKGEASTPDEIAVRTGLTNAEVARGIKYLEDRGMVEKGDI